MDTLLYPPNLADVLETEQVHIRIPSSLEWIEPAVEHLKNRAVAAGVCSESRSRKLMLALHEALTNSVVHGNLEAPSELKEQGDEAFVQLLAARAANPDYAQRVVDIHVSYDGDQCRWMLTDEGKGFDVARVLRRLEQPDPDELISSGRGLLMMKAFLDEVRYELGGRRVVLTLCREAGQERRRYPRLSVQHCVRVAPIDENGAVDWHAAQDGLLHNVSMEGLAVLQERLATSDRVLVGIFSEGQPLYVPAEIRHWRALADKVVELGCQVQATAPLTALYTPSTAQAIEGFVARLSQTPQDVDERRTFPRVIYTESITIQGLNAGDPTTGFARDISKGGIAFVTTAPLSLDVRQLTLPLQGDGSLRVMARILRCTRIMEGFYDVAAQFLAPQS
jgi:anti-sigma regulatory factor (Ser/Thr protein kinase)